MESFRTRTFREQLRECPKEVRKQAYDAYRRFVANPWDPALKFKCLKGRIWSARIGSTGWRAIGFREGDLIVWDFLGDHDAYETRIRRL